MIEHDNGGPAFPPTFGLTGEIGLGMTLRDYFAGQALVSLVTDREAMAASDSEKVEFARFAAVLAYAFSDAMLEARE